MAARVSVLAGEHSQRCQSLTRTLERRLQALHEQGLAPASAGTPEVMLEYLAEARQRAREEVGQRSVAVMKASVDGMNARISAIETEVEGIDTALKRVETDVIAEATVVATTLTSAFLRDAIQARRFDTVILDEASMAPIPALWVAASLSDANLIIVGDPEQIPPIVNSEHEIAKHWLGRDAFTVHGVSGSTPYLVALRRQFRMHPEISAIPNSLIYEGNLVDDACTYCENADEWLSNWYRLDWGHDAPVLLIDTGSIGAWATSVPRGNRASRLNFYSATLCVDIAERMLRDGRPEPQPGSRRHMMIVCPYRAHAQLLQLLLREQKLDGWVAAGTAHSFQGTEAEVVILDLVNDDPHWRVGLFMTGNDEANKRLLNVAFTRARRRLVVVGDFAYMKKNGAKAFLGRELLPFLQSHYGAVDAKSAVPSGLSARVAGTITVLQPAPLPLTEPCMAVTQEEFYPLLLQDFANARERIILYSPFMTTERVNALTAHVRSSVERGVRVYVITKSHDDRSRSELSLYRHIERGLTESGVTIVHKRRMHEKLVFVDRDILWIGSLNPLSFSGSQEVMDRRKSHGVVEHYAKLMRLESFLGECRTGTPTCPACGVELVAREGAREPFYWECTNGGCGYKRNADDYPLTEGMVVCRRCGEPVEFALRGKTAVWRCTRNPRHSERIIRAHLFLPKMRELVPAKALRLLDAHFGLDIDRLHEQASLFG